MKNKIKRIFALLMSSIMMINTALAIDTSVIDEKWGKATFVYGSGLSSNEIKETARLLGIENIDNVNLAMVDGQDEIKYLGSGSGDDSAMISSVLVQKKGEGTGIDLEITTPSNITQISEGQYRNAAITAGVTDCAIVVGSIKPVTGESALTGIYKAFEANGQVLDRDRMVVAQEELEITNEIAQENKNKDGFNIDTLNQVIIEVKQEINNYYNNNETKADAQEIEQFIIDTIEKYDLENVITQDQIDRLIQLFADYQQTGAIDSQAVLDELSMMADDLSEVAGQIYEDAKESGILDKIVDFIQSILNAISNALSGN